MKRLPTLIFAALVGVSTMAAAQTPSIYYFGRIGLFNDPAYLHPGNPPGSSYTTSSTFLDLTDSGYAVGSSQRYNFLTFNLPPGQDLWVTNTVTGITKEIGLYNPGTTHDSTLLGITESGIAFGQSTIYESGGFPPPSATASWVADAESGVTVRTGLYGPEYTGPFGFAFSQLIDVTEAGMAFGHSVRMTEFGYNGNAAWIMNTDNGITSRVGFFSADYNQGGTQNSFITGVSSLGYVSGHSERFIANVPMGQTAWVAAAVTGGTYPVGLYQPPLYLRPDGYGHTTARAISDSCYVIGSSARFDGSANVGRAAWAHNLNTNTVKRLGLTTAEFTDSTTGAQISESTGVSESGFVSGYSRRFSGTMDLGQAAWMANFTSGITARAGLTSAEFTKSNGYQYSAVQVFNDPSLSFPLQRNLVPQSGHGYGNSTRYINDEERGNAVWVFNKNNGATTRVGFYNSPQYIGADGATVSTFNSEYPASDHGYVLGSSRTYTPSGDILGQTHWLTTLELGGTKAVGFTGPEYTAPNSNKITTIQGFHSGGYVYGTSQRYVGGAPLGQAAWLVNVHASADTERIGLFGTPEFVLADGSENSVIVGANPQNGWIWGYSTRSEAYGGGQVGWIHNMATGVRSTLKAQVAPDGKTHTMVNGAVGYLMVYGTFTAYHPVTSAPLGTKNFVWTYSEGFKILEDQMAPVLAANNWTSITSFKLNRYGIIIAQGQRGIYTAANPGGAGVFRAYFVQ